MSKSSLTQLVQKYLASDDPLPQEAVHIVGDGDFRAIGAEFLRYLVDIGGMRGNDDVLDIGCGFGRIALPLARYLEPASRYLGFDIVQEPIEWCEQHVAPLHPGFAFTHLDHLHPLYNPGGNVRSAQGFIAGLPDAAVFEPSFAFAVSVFTHLDQASIERYLAELGIILRSGGTFFMTAFLVGEGSPGPGPRCSFPALRWRREGLLTALQGEPLTAAVGIPLPWLLERAMANGLLPRQVHYGHWRWGAGHAGSFQDILVFTKSGAEALCTLGRRL